MKSGSPWIEPQTVSATICYGHFGMDSVFCLPLVLDCKVHVLFVTSVHRGIPLDPIFKVIIVGILNNVNILC